MTGRFEPKEAFALYSLLVLLLACFFFAGVYIGRNQPAVQREEVVGESLETSQEALGSEDIASTVDFYENLSTPPRSGLETQQVAPEIVIDSSEGSIPPAGAASDAPEAMPVAQPRTVAGSSPDSGAPRYTIQVAAHSTEAEAQQTLLKLSAREFEGRISRPAEGSNDPYYRVWVGSFESAEAARGLEAELKSKGFYTYVRRTN